MYLIHYGGMGGPALANTIEEAKAQAETCVRARVSRCNGGDGEPVAYYNRPGFNYPDAKAWHLKDGATAAERATLLG